MQNISTRFIVVAVAAGFCGMNLGMGMAMAQDFRLAPAHAHLNLLGWVSMFLYGLFYRCVPEAATGILPKLQFWLATLGLGLMVPALAFVLLGRPELEPVVGLGGLLTISALAVFGLVILRSLRQPHGERLRVLAPATSN